MTSDETIQSARATLKRWRLHPEAMVREEFGIEPDPWQLKVLRAFADPKVQRIGMKAPICVDSVVWTPTGERRWKDIMPGDVLFAEDGTITKVVRRFDAGHVPLYRVSFRDGTSLRVSSDHEWDVQTPYDRTIGRRRTVSTAELMKMRLRNHKSRQRLVSIPKQGAVQFTHADLPVDPYVFGLWLGDGIANEARLIAPDIAIRDAIRQRGQEITESEAVPKRIGLSGISTGLKATGAMHCRSYEKYIPNSYKIASSDQRLLLLRGLMDSDGTCAKNGHCYLASCSEQLIDDFLWLARSLGYIATKMGPYQINGGENRDSFRAVICGDVCPFLADTSKKRRWRVPTHGKTLRFIESVEADGEGEAMCVEVANDSHCFQASDFIVTHNCKGPGKTAVLAWCAWNFITCYMNPKMAGTSISGDNLSDGLWTEMAKWMHTRKDPDQPSFLEETFEWTKTRIYYKAKPETWWFSARTWSKSADSSQQADTLAGLHADYLLFILDEAGGIPDAVMAAAEAGLATGIVTKILMAGNPTNLEGPLYRACTSERHLWTLIEITGDPDDPNRSTRISIDWARAQIEKYGADNPWVLVNVFGKFPPASLNAIIGPDDCSAAMNRHLRADQYNFAAKVLGVDVARYGDDSTVLFPRQGMAAFKPVIMRNANTLEIAARVAQAYKRWDADAIMVDDTGGWGAGVIDACIQAGLNVIPINFAGKADDPRYYNKRAEMAFRAAEWIKLGGALPNLPQFTRQATAHTYTFKSGKFLLEPKEQIKDKLAGMSPDEFDGFILTFAVDVPPRKEVGLAHHSAGRAAMEYDIYAEGRD